MLSDNFLNRKRFVTCDHLPLVQHPFWVALGILEGVVDADVLQIEGLFQDLVGVGPAGAVGLAGGDISLAQGGLALDAPFRCVRGELDGDGAAHIVGHPKGFLHELLDDVGGKPGGPQPSSKNL